MQAELRGIWHMPSGTDPREGCTPRRGMSGEMREAPDLCHAGRALFVRGGGDGRAALGAGAAGVARQAVGARGTDAGDFAKGSGVIVDIDSRPL